VAQVAQLVLLQPVSMSGDAMGGMAGWTMAETNTGGAGGTANAAFMGQANAGLVGGQQLEMTVT
jgi:hypothetical protein